MTLINSTTLNRNDLDNSRTVEYGKRVLREKLAGRHADPANRPAIRRIILRLREIR